MIYATCGCGVVTLLLFILKSNKTHSVQGTFLKTLTSMFFILTAAVAMYQNPNYSFYGLLTIVGLVFGMLGDIFLDQKWIYDKDKDWFLSAGFLVFAVGHGAYAVAMFKTFEFGLRDAIFPVVFGIAVVLFNAILEKPTKQNFGKFRPIVLSYAFVVAFMAGTGIWAAITERTTAAILLAVAGVMFLGSDLILSPMYFKPGRDIPLYFIINHVAYYIAQYLIAFSIAVIGK